MKNFIRKTTAFLMLSCGIAVTAPHASAQFVVEDILNLEQSVKSWITRQLEEHEKLLVLTQQLAQAHSLFQQGEAIYNTVTSYVKNGQQYWDLYAAGKRLYYDIEMVKSYMQYMKVPSGPDFSDVSTAIRTTASTALDYYYEIQQLAYFTELILKDMQTLMDDANLILGGGNKMDNASNLNQIGKDTEKLNEDAEIIEKALRDQLRKQYDEGQARATLAIIEKATSGLDRLKPRKVISIDEDQLANTAFDDGYDVKDDINRNTYDKAIDLVCVIIGVMALFMIAWGYARMTKGERQHVDALWKVFAGIIFIILLLQLIKAAVIPTFIN